MKQQVAVGIVAVALVGGSATGLVVREMRSDASVPAAASTQTSAPAPTSTPTPSASPQTSEPASTPTASPSQPQLLPLGSLQINTGAVGPVRVGMTKAQAAATGYFNVDVPNEVCEGATPLEWTSNYVNALDVLVDQDGRIATVGISGRGPKTRSGLGINSTYKQVRKVLGPGRLPEPAGYVQTGLFINDGDAWIGFLFDPEPDVISDSDVVKFIEVTKGRKPNLMRDGC